MQLLMSIIVFISSQGSLDSYHLHIDAFYLDSLYADSLADLQFPAYIETPAGCCSCLAGFRGGTSLECPKKSWKFELSDPSLLNASHVLLDAQYRDQSLMRNVLGLLLSRRLGFPAPMTEHVELHINDVYYGVYVEVERIDEYFFARNDLGCGPLFKAIDHLGRFVWQPCDTLGTTGFEPRQGSEEYLPHLRSLIDRVNLNLPLSFRIEDFLSSAAISLAIRDEDAITKNFYLHLPADSIWRFYPWDRDASFGNNWNGVYQPEWINSTSMYCLEISSMLTTLLLDEDNGELFEDYLEEAASVMEDELPAVIDSIYLEIRESVYADTMKKGSNDDFDDAVQTLRSAVIERAQFIPSISEPEPVEIESMTLSQWDFPEGTADDSLTISVEFGDSPYSVGANFWSDGGDVDYIGLIEDASSDNVWSRTIAFPPQFDHMKFAIIYKVDTPLEYDIFHYPFYSFPTSTQRRVCAPTARRSDYPDHIADLEVLDPIRYTSFLWSIPIVNESSIPLDLSFYGFQVGSSRLFAPSDALLPPGDTLRLTNSSELLEFLIPGRMVFGNLALDSPAGLEITIIYPSWETAFSTSVGSEIQHGESALSLILSEICYSGDGGDWIELCNTGLSIADLSGSLLIDRCDHICTIPENVTINPGDFLIICESYDSFRSVYGSGLNVVQALEFGLNSTRDGVSLISDDRLVFSVMYENPPWPLGEGILSLILPDMPIEEPCSWEGVEPPGTPGEPNPGWPVLFFEPKITDLWPNPVRSSLSAQYRISAPGEILVYDISGRSVMQPSTLENYEGTYFCELPATLRPGVYFVVVRSMGTIASKKFILLR
jgi:spore coat protein H